MAGKLADFTKPECEFLRLQCNFTPEEREVFDLRVSDHSIVQISLMLGMSTATVSRKIQNIKRKIHKVS